jgi:hypothetical protein
VAEPVKDDETQGPIPEAWRSTLAAIVDSIARGDSVAAADLSEVEVDSKFAADCRNALEQCGDVTLVPLPEQTWETSVCIWNGDHWSCLVDLWTREEGRSDLVLELSVFEDGLGYRFEPYLVYVP